MDWISYCFRPNEAFEERNREYGAFRLRKYYNKRLMIALGTGVVAFSVGIASPVIYKSLESNRNETMEISRVVELKAIEPPPLDPKEPPPPVAPPPPPKISTVRFVPPEVAPDEEVPEDEIPPPQDELKEVQAAAVTQEGDPDANPNEIVIEDPINSDAEVVGTPQQEEVFVIVEQMPEFPGGTNALLKYLSENIAYPDIARKAGVEGRVILQFIIGRDGNIRDIEVVRGIGAGLDEEAVRAVREMPAWIPGKQNGKPVSVKFSMPVVFRLR